jgi:hypothetical protein
MDAKVAKVNGKDYIFAVLHGENKNEIYCGVKYLNNVMSKQEYNDDQFSGVVNGQYNDYAPAYFAFCSLAVIPAEDFKKGVNLDDPKYNKGPIAWPDNGYLTQSGEKASMGSRHHSIFIDDNYVYVFTCEGTSLKVIRSPLASLGDPMSFKTVKDGDFSVESLPKGFDKNDRSFFAKKPEASQYILSNTNTFGFSVAKIKDTNYYIAVEEYYTEWPASGIRLRISKDILNWSDPVNIPGAFVEDYHAGTLHYPRLFNADFTDSNVIDPENFHIVGMSGNWIASARIDAVKMSIAIG